MDLWLLLGGKRKCCPRSVMLVVNQQGSLDGEDVGEDAFT